MDKITKLSRRSFIKGALAGACALFLSQLSSGFGLAQDLSNGRKKKNIKGSHDLAVCRGDDPAELTRTAVDAMGGMSRFVKKGDVVVVKPNIAWDRQPEYAATTNPAVVAAIVQMCFEAGAKRVNVFDNTCNSAQRCYENTGIRQAAEEKGAKVYFCDNWNFVKAHFPFEAALEGWPVFRDAIDCDVFINVPVLKHHGLAGLTVSMKNLMGICGGSRGLIHLNIGRKLAEITSFINPDLTIVDCYRMLTRHGPSGGSLDDVKLLKTVICATDPCLADAFAAKLAGYDPGSIPGIAEGVKLGLGSSDIGKADIVEI